MSEKAPKPTKTFLLRLKEGYWEMELIEGQQIATEYYKGIHVPQVSTKRHEKQTFVKEPSPGQHKAEMMTYNHSDNSVRLATPDEISSFHQQMQNLYFQIYEEGWDDPSNDMNRWSNWNENSGSDISNVQNLTGDD